MVTAAAAKDEACLLINLLNDNNTADMAAAAAAAATTDVDVVVAAAAAAALKTDTGASSRKRSRENSVNGSKRNSTGQILHRVDDFDTLFDEVSGGTVNDEHDCEGEGEGEGEGNMATATSATSATAVREDVFAAECVQMTRTSQTNAKQFQTTAFSSRSGTTLVSSSTDNHRHNDAVDDNATATTNVSTNAFSNSPAVAVAVAVSTDETIKRQYSRQQRQLDQCTADVQVDLLSNQQSPPPSGPQHVPYARNTSSEQVTTTTTTTTTMSHEQSTSLIEECRYNIPENVIKDVVRESKFTTTSTTQKKTTRKKKSVAQTAENENVNVNSNSAIITASSNTTTTTTSSSLSNANANDNATNGIVPKTKKSKKSKKHADEKENISVRSGFGKFDQLTKKTLLHVRSSDSSKAQQHFSQNENGVAENACNVCKACNKTVFAMELIKAERAVWHRNCFRCNTCNKQLTVDIYSSHEGKLFCKPHFKDLFKPKVVVENEAPVKLKRPEMIIRENQPLELPPDVVRASDKPDLGLDELSSLNVRSRFQVFEKQNTEEDDSISAAADRSAVCVKRSPSILSKLARFQAKGMDVGVSSDIFNGIDYEESTSSEEEDEQSNTNESNGITKSVVSREKPIAFNKMNDVKKNWENGQTAKKEERREERREELQRIRSRLFMGKQGKMKEAYENAVAESEKTCVKRDVEIRAEKARLIKEKFEKGQVVHDEDSDDDEQVSAKKPAGARDEDMDVFEAGISKKSRSLFQQMDAAVKSQTQTQTQAQSQSQSKNVTGPSAAATSAPALAAVQNGQKQKVAAAAAAAAVDRQLSSENVVRASDPVDEIVVQTADISSKFKFFETYKPPEVKRKAFRITPPREGQLIQSNSPEREVPDGSTCVARCEPDVQDESELLKKSNTTAKMLSLFRQLEEAQQVVPDGPKPMKKFTPPPMSSEASSEEEDDDEDEDDDDDGESTDEDRLQNGDRIIRACDKTEDEYLKLAQAAAKAKSLKEKFEKWQPEQQSNNNAVNMLESEQASLDTTKSLRARFESFRSEQPQDKPRPKVNRFVDKTCKSLPGCCDTCFKTVYQLEKVEAGDKVFHRSCFRCSRCNGVLRMETFTMNNGQLYCVPHFKQLFIAKGNYDEGFGNYQHKNKWPVKPDVVPLVSSS
ncbi:uncharacterized protein LOC135843452 isoform X3 [Planococcus citri]|uniref:uncharacterized protein LOC135843452 isoform X3 n=1 Tax=Planococcus citri TaxID=170843 RepID=UPI0031F9C0F3